MTTTINENVVSVLYSRVYYNLKFQEKEIKSVEIYD